MRRVRELLLLLPLGACYLFIGAGNPGLASGIPLFFAFFAAFVALPALGLGGLLLRRPLSPSERLFLGGPPALAILFCLVWAAAALRQPWLVWAQPAAGLIALLAGLGIARSAGPNAEDPAEGASVLSWPDLLIVMSVLAAGLALCLPKFAQVSLPHPGVLVDYYNDDVGQAAYTFASLRALEHGLPVIQPLVEGQPLVYHLLYNFCMAACTFVTGLHPLDQVLFLWPPVLWLMLAGAAATACRRLAGLSKRETVVAVVLLLFTTGVDFNATPGVQLFAYHHSFFVGLPALFLLLCALYGRLSGRQPDLPVILAALCYLVCAVTKAHLLLLLPVSLLPVLVARVVRRQSNASELVLAALVGVMGIALRLAFYPGTERVAMRIPNLGKLFMGALGNLGEMGVVFGVYIVLLLFAADANPPLRHKLGRDRQYQLFCLGMVVVSVVLLKWFNFAGGDFYFYWHSRMAVLLAAAPVMTHLLVWRSSRLAAFSTALLLLLGVGATLQATLLPKLFSPVENWRPQDARMKQLDDGERQGLRWAAANLDRQRVFFTNKDQFLGAYLGGYIPIDLYDSLGLSGLQGYAWAPAWLPEDLLRVAAARRARLRDFFDAATPQAKEVALVDIEADYYFHSLRGPNAQARLPECLREVHRTASLIIFENTCRRAVANGAGERRAANE